MQLLYSHKSNSIPNSAVEAIKIAKSKGLKLPIIYNSSGYEKVETIPLIVIKKDNIREQYDRSKIEKGVLRACYKLPIPADRIQKTVDQIETEIFNLDYKEVPTTVIGEIVMEKLKELHEVAYVRFASIYREFKDVNTFMDEIKKILKK